MYSPPERGIEPESTPHTSGKPKPTRTSEMTLAQSRLPVRYVPRPQVIIVQMLGVMPWFIMPTAMASVIDRPRTRPLALRANASSSATLPP